MCSVCVDFSAFNTFFILPPEGAKARKFKILHTLALSLKELFSISGTIHLLSYYCTPYFSLVCQPSEHNFPPFYWQGPVGSGFILDRDDTLDVNGLML